MKVLALSSYGVLGGAELSLSAFLDHRPNHVEAEVLLLTDGPLRERLARLGIPVFVAAGYEGRPTLARLVRFTRELSRFLERRRPDVVWAMGVKAALLAVPACRARDVRIVWHKVDFSWDRILAVPLAFCTSGVVAVSQAIGDTLGPAKRWQLLGVVGPPVELDEDVQGGANAARITIGTLARLVPYKGHHHLIRAAAMLSREFPELRVILAGAPAPEYPDYPRSLRTLAEEHGLADRVELPGFVPAARVLERLTVFVNATYRDEQGFGLEGLSGAMLEASLAGVAVVATPGGGTAEGVVDGVTGTLVERADPSLLASAIAPYLRDRELTARVGAAGREFVRARFAPEPAAGALFELLTGSPV